MIKAYFLLILYNCLFRILFPQSFTNLISTLMTKKTLIFIDDFFFKFFYILSIHLLPIVLCHFFPQENNISISRHFFFQS